MICNYVVKCFERITITRKFIRCNFFLLAKDLFQKLLHYRYIEKPKSTDWKQYHRNHLTDWNKNWYSASTKVIGAQQETVLTNSVDIVVLTAIKCLFFSFTVFLIILQCFGWSQSGRGRGDKGSEQWCWKGEGRQGCCLRREGVGTQSLKGVLSWFIES